MKQFRGFIPKKKVLTKMGMRLQQRIMAMLEGQKVKEGT